MFPEAWQLLVIDFPNGAPIVSDGGHILTEKNGQWEQAKPYGQK